jgi:manganese/zinc/iron transport system substrate-binding protein
MNKYSIFLFFCVIAGLFASFWWFSINEEIRTDEKLHVVTTTGIIADAVQEIGGDKVQVQALMGPGVDPHLYHARESDIQRLASADIIFYSGLHLEGKMGILFERMSKQLPTYAVTEVIQPEQLRSSGFAGLYDPHVWFNVQLWSQVIAGIRDRLIEHDPKNAEVYKKRGEAYLKTLQELNAYIKHRASELPKSRRVLITAHDAFNYFGDAYGFEVVGLQGISTDSDVGTADVTRLVDLIVERAVPVVFTEASIPSRNIEAVQRAAQARGQKVAIGPELYSDTLGEHGTMAETYSGMVRSNIDMIIEALSETGR